MCGICGAAGLEDKQLIERMRDSMTHRGPDDKGVFVGDGISLGHRRLSIIDLSTQGCQPMSNEDGSIWIVYNGETYNYRELRGELEAEGHNFKSNTDTEVLVHAYEEYGLDFMSKTRGQCAVAIWDSKKRRLVMARDRLGIKPLYYSVKDGMLFFASEMKALFKYEGLKPEVNYFALDNYLTFQYVPEPESIFKNVFKVLPAEIVVYENGKLDKKIYWDLNLTKTGPAKTESQYVKELSGKLDEAVNLEMVSDVPVGVHLSGGIDSSSIAAIMSGLVKEPIRTFSIGYDQDKVEVKYAKIVSDYLGTDHQEIIVQPDEVVGELGEIVWHLDEPIGDPAIMPQYFLGKYTKKKVTVVFNGGGSDEIFAGYRAYKYLTMAEKVRQITPAFIRENAAKAIAKMEVPARYKRYIEYIGSSEEEKVYWGQGLLFDKEERSGLYTDILKEKTRGNNPAQTIRKHLQAKKQSTYLLNRFLYVDIKSWLTDNCTMLLDKVMMAHAVEGRVPFLDYKLVEYAMTIPPELKMRGNTEKYILRKALTGKLPKAIIERPKKGFGVPTDDWLFKDVNNMVTDRLRSSEFIRQNFNKDRIEFLLKGTRDFRHSHQLFGLLVLDLWHEKYLRS